MGDNLYWMITITDRNQSQKFLSFYKTYGIEVVLSTLGKGTAASEILNDFGLEATQKAVLLSVVTGKVWSAVQKGLQTIMPHRYSRHRHRVHHAAQQYRRQTSAGVFNERSAVSERSGRRLERYQIRASGRHRKPGLYRADYGRSAPRKRRRAAPLSTRRAPAWRARKSFSAFPSPVKKSLCSSS